MSAGQPRLKINGHEEAPMEPLAILFML